MKKDDGLDDVGIGGFHKNRIRQIGDESSNTFLDRLKRLNSQNLF